MGGLLSYSDYPGLDSREQGRMPNFGYGAVEGLLCPAVEGGMSAVLSSTVSQSDINVDVKDSSRLPEPPFTLQAGAEQVRVSAISGNALTVIRGYNGTRPAVHPEGRMLFEVRSRYVYLVADCPVRAVNALYIDGSRATGNYAIYTGQPGDELAGYEGKAVMSIDCAPFVGKQFNITREAAFDRASGVEIQAVPVAWSSSEIVGSSSSVFALVWGPEARPTAWVAFDRAHGTVLGQRYRADVENPSLDHLRTRMIVRRGGLFLFGREFMVPAQTRTTVELWRGPGQEDDELVLTPLGGQLRVYSMAKTLTIDDSLEPEPTLSIELPPAGTLTKAALKLSALGRRKLRTGYAAGPSGTVRSQRHHIKVTEASGTNDARVRVVAGSSVFGETLIQPGASETVSLTLEGGEWTMPTVVLALKGEVLVNQINKTVVYYPASADSLGEGLSTCSSRIVVGERVSVDAELIYDSDGSYAGTGTLIERPDHVMHHFLTKRMGFGVEDIDSVSFNTAGISYAAAVSGGYRLAFVMTVDNAPSEVLMRLAQESRSSIRFEAGKWKLSFLPDNAPEPVKIISSGDLAGECSMFVFDRSTLGDLANTLVSRYRSDLAQKGDWLGVAYAVDSESVAKFGVYSKEIELSMIRDTVTAESVLEYMLKRSATQLLRVTFPVFYEHFDLRVGDTIGIENPLYNGRRFYIENISRIDRFRAEIKAIEWWGA